MTDWYTGPGGSAANGGTSWADRKDTITNLLTVAYAAGDRLLCGPGVYRENVTLNGSGSSVYNVNTIDVTHESTALVGNATNFVAGGVQVGDQFFAGNLASGNDGQTFGNNQFQSATGNFQASMIGFMIEIIGYGAYTIAAVAAVTTITLADHNGIGWPAAGGPGIDYYVVSGEGPYEITAVVDGANLTIHKPWSGPTVTAAGGVRGVDYLIYRPVYLIGDVTGFETDSIGGVVRITGSDDDETLNRTYGIDATSRDYWLIRGFYVSNLSYPFLFDACDYITIEDCITVDGGIAHIEFDDSIAATIRRCIQVGAYAANCFSFTASPQIDNGQCLAENLYCDAGDGGIAQLVGGCTFKNITLGFHNYRGFESNQGTGRCLFVRNCQVVYCITAGVDANALGDLIEDYNNFWDNTPHRTATVAAGSNSTTNLYLPTLPRLLDQYQWPFLFFPPSEWENSREITGFYQKNEDVYGVVRPITDNKRSWGFTQWYTVQRSTTLFYGTFTGSLYMPDAMDLKVIGACVEDTTYTITVQVYLQPGYAGNAPQMIIRQAGAADVVVTATGATGAWEQLSTAYTTGLVMDWITVILRSRNTSAVAPYGVAWNNLTIN